jgi:hypothetical protein
MPRNSDNKFLIEIPVYRLLGRMVKGALRPYDNLRLSMRELPCLFIKEENATLKRVSFEQAIIFD